jgi:hypothetical protein
MRETRKPKTAARLSMDARLKVARTAFNAISRGPKKAHMTYATSHNATMLRIVRVERAWSNCPN